jgi:hypothetical protein
LVARKRQDPLKSHCYMTTSRVQNHELRTNISEWALKYFYLLQHCFSIIWPIANGRRLTIQCQFEWRSGDGGGAGLGGVVRTSMRLRDSEERTVDWSMELLTALERKSAAQFEVIPFESQDDRTFHSLTSS